MSSQRQTLYSLAITRQGRVNIPSGFNLNTTCGTICVEKHKGRGSFGDVFEAKQDAERQRKVAIKISRIPSNYQDFSVKEAKRLKTFSSNHVIGLIDEGFFNFKGRKIHFILTPFLDFTLYQYTQKTEFTDNMLKQLAHNISSGLDHIHSEGFVHCDLKPENIMWNATKKCWVIIDVGSAQHMATFKNNKEHFYIQSRWWRAPEILRMIVDPYTHYEITSAIDMWSLGCILYETATKKPLFPGSSSSIMLGLIQITIGPIDSPIPFYPEHKNISKLLANLIRFLVSYERLTANEVLRHPYLIEDVPGVSIVPSDKSCQKRRIRKNDKRYPLTRSSWKKKRKTKRRRQGYTPVYTPTWGRKSDLYTEI